MQSIAFELGIAETAYLTPSDDPAIFGLRWFSPAVEIDLCGHATLASAHVLRESGMVDGGAALTFHTRSGPSARVLRRRHHRARLSGRPGDPGPAARVPGRAVAGRRRGQRAERLLHLRGARLGRGRRRLRARPRRHRRDRVPALLLTAAATPGSGADYVLRVFGPNVGIDEDPATGSAQCVAGPYWAAELGRDDLVARQLSRRGATLYVRPGAERVAIAGRATTVLTGELC